MNELWGRGKLDVEGGLNVLWKLQLTFYHIAVVTCGAVSKES